MERHGTAICALGQYYNCTITVDYGMAVEEAIKLGRYDWVDPIITSRNFKTSRKGKVELEVELIHFNRWISTDEALKEFDQMGYRPAELHELLSLGAKFPELQREFSISGLGSVWQAPHGFHHAPNLYRDVPKSLYRDVSKRFLSIYCLEFNWFPDSRFAAVRK